MTRRLRIAVSVFFAVFCVALVMLWVRSFWRNDRMLIPTPFNRPVCVESVQGQTIFSKTPDWAHSPNSFHWIVVVIDKDFGNGAPIKEPTFEWYSVDGLTGLMVPYRFLLAVSGIIAIVMAYPLPEHFSRRKRVVMRMLVAATFVAIAWIAS